MRRYRFPDMFPDADHVRDMQRELDQIIQLGVANITRLVRAAEARSPGAVIIDSEDDFEMKHRKQRSVGFASEMVNDGDDDIPLKKSPGDGSSSSSRLSSSFLQARNAMKKGGRGIGEVKVGQGRLASQLIKKGLITPEVLAKLQAEWQLAGDKGRRESGSEGKHSAGSDTDSDPRSTFSRRGRRR